MTSTAMGHFPHGADPRTHLARMPYPQALGFVWLKGGGDGVVLQMWPDAANRDANGALHTLALLSILDHACSAAVYQALSEPKHIATIDLRCEFADAPGPGAGVDCHALTVHIDGSFAIVRASVVCQVSGKHLAYASSTYAIGAHPGMQNKTVVPLSQSFAAAASRHPPADFESILGLREADAGWVLPFSDSLIGGLSLPSMHGGAIGASLTLAAISLAQRELEMQAAWRPLTVSIQYLRAVEALPTRIEASLRKRGRRSCVVSTSASQTAGRESAIADCLLVSGPRS